MHIMCMCMCMCMCKCMCKCMCMRMFDGAQGLEAAWTLLDYKWMDTAMPLQLVHDIEDG